MAAMGKGLTKQDKVMAYAAKTGEAVDAVPKGKEQVTAIATAGNKKGKFIPHMGRKLESDEIVATPTVDASTAQSIMQARQKKGWTQAQLAKVEQSAQGRKSARR